MTRKIKVITCLILSLYLSVIQFSKVDAFILNENNNISTQISYDAESFVRDHYLEIVEVYLSYSENKIDELENDYELGFPFVIYNPEEDIQKEIYYFPVYYNDRIILNISAINTTDGWTLSASDEMINGLNKLKYSGDNANEFLFYQSSGKIVAQTQDKNEVIFLIDKQENGEYSAKNVKSDRFEKLSYENKKAEIIENIRYSEEVDIDEEAFDNDSFETYTPGFSTDTSSTKECKLYNAKGQGSLPICWAASTFDGNGNGHAVTIYGYRSISTSDYIVFWNPGLASTQVVYYLSGGSTYTYNNKTWTWTKSLSKYV